MDHEASMYTSSQTSSSRDSGTDDQGAAGAHGLFEGNMHHQHQHHQVALQRPPVAGERNYATHPVHASYGDSFEGHGHYPAAIQMPRMPFEYYHHPLSYGFAPWPMSYPMNPGLCFPPYPHERGTERPVNDVSGGSDSDIQPKVEPSQEETQSSIDPHTSETKLEDLLVSAS